MQLNKLVTFYLVAWLCFANFFFLALDARKAVRRYNPADTSNTVTTNNNNGISVNVDANVCLPLVGDFTTFTQVEFGTKGTKAYVLLNANFLNLFPQGIKIGANITLLDNGLVGDLLGGVLNLVGGLVNGLLGGNLLQILLTDVDAIEKFLPQLASPGALTQALKNPTTETPGGLLAGDLLALALNIALDVNVQALSLVDVDLSTLVFVDGPCAGLSVKVVLDLANSVLGAVINPLLGSPIVLPADIDVCVSTINSNFYDGLKVGAHLVLPGLNLQACLNLNLPVIAANANVQLSLLAPLSRTVGVFLDLQLLGLVDVDVDLAIGNGQRYHTFGLDLVANLQLKAGLVGTLVDLKVIVPKSGVGALLNNVVSTVGYIADDVLCLVNYLLNFAPLSATGLDLQAVIYMLVNAIDDVNTLIARVPDLADIDAALVQVMLNDVKTNGQGFVPAPGQFIGVVANVKIAGISLRVLLEVTVPSIDLSVKTNLCPALHH